MLTHIASKDEFEEKTKKGRVIVDFFATWCGPCSMLSPILEQLAKEHPEVEVLKVDVDEHPEIASLFDVYSIPTLLYYEDGTVKNKKLGYMPMPALKAFASIK